MKIVYLYTALTTIGGADRIVSQKANYLADKMGHEVYIITDSQNGRPTAFPLSSKVKHIDMGIDFGKQYNHHLLLRFFYYKWFMHKYRNRLEKTYRMIQPDITISTLGRDMDFLTEMKDGSIKIGESHIAKQYMRNFHLMEAKGGIHKMAARYWRKKQEKAIRKLDALVVLTKEDAQNWKRTRNTIVIPNFLTLDIQQASSCRGKKAISVGRLNEQKGYDLLIPAWGLVVQKHPDWLLEIYGEGELRNELEHQISAYQLTAQIKICPPTPRITEKYQESAFLIMSSRFEGFGLVLTEAMSCGLPCVSFDCPSGPSEIIQNKVDGILVENGNIGRLAAAICYMIEHEEERIKMGMNAKNNISRYSKENIMRQWDALFNHLTKNGAL